MIGKRNQLRDNPAGLARRDREVGKQLLAALIRIFLQEFIELSIEVLMYAGEIAGQATDHQSIEDILRDVTAHGGCLLGQNVNFPVPFRSTIWAALPITSAGRSSPRGPRAHPRPRA